LDWTGLSVLVTGATGSFGRKFVATMLSRHRLERLIVFSRDELKQHEMRQALGDTGGSPVRYFLGDVRDRDRLYRAFHGVDVVIHAAALKQVPALEYNPFEAVLTNITGSKNIVDAAIDTGVGRVIALSTDKAVNPINLYGATKLVAEKLFVQGNSYVGQDRETRFSVVRYGNVFNSRGGVVPVFREQRKSGVLTITDKRMTRFCITLDQGVDFVISCTEEMQGGEVFVPKIPSMNVMDLAHAIAPDCRTEFTGIRPGEKLHEVLVSVDESHTALELENSFVIEPQFPWWERKTPNSGKPLADGFSYTSNNNTEWLSVPALQEMLGDYA
jgi:UDP-N-acetylglucosamine 4,6-dehydratase/5-epimerase